MRNLGTQSVKAYVVFGLVASLLALVVTIPLLMDPIGSPAVALVCGITGAEFRERCIRYLAERMTAKDAPMWDVQVDDVLVGRIDDDEYASILHGVWTDPRNYVAQVMNCLNYVASICLWTLTYLPLIVFWGALTYAAAAPAAFIVAWHATTTTVLQSPDELILQIGNVAPFVPFFLLMVVTFSIPVAHLLGWRNMFKARVDAILRVRFNTTGNGRAVLRRMENGEPVFAGIL